MKFSVIDTTCKKSGKYEYGETLLQLPDHDFDINLRLPNGQLVALQWRIESPSMDVVLPENLSVVNWIGDDMEPAPKVKDCPAHIRQAKQLVIEFAPEVLES